MKHKWLNVIKNKFISFFDNRFFNSRYGVVFVGFIFTGIAGVWFNYFIQNTIAQREHNFEIYKRNIDAAEKILEKTTDMINSRMFHLQRVIWAYQYGEALDAKKDWAAYKDTITSWNIHDMTYVAKLKRYYDSPIANAFWQNKPPNPSIHKYFYNAHRSVLLWKSCLIKACASQNTRVCKTKVCTKEKKNTMQTLVQLKKHVIDFVYRINTVYETKYLRNTPLTSK